MKTKVHRLCEGEEHVMGNYEGEDHVMDNYEGEDHVMGNYEGEDHVMGNSWWRTLRVHGIYIIYHGLSKS